MSCRELFFEPNLRIPVIKDKVYNTILKIQGVRRCYVAPTCPFKILIVHDNEAVPEKVLEQLPGAKLTHFVFIYVFPNIPLKINVIIS